MKRLFGLFLLAGIFASCTNNTKEKKAEADTTTATGEIIVNELDSLALVGQTFKAIDSSFDTNSFEQTGQSAVTASAASVEMEQVQPFLSYLLYNTDSTLAIDPYSYNYILQEKNGEKRIVDAGPDAEVALFNPKSKTRQRIWFSGPGARVVDVKWKNETVVWIAGLEEVSPKAHVPFIQEVDTRTNTVLHYEAGDTIQAVPENLLKEGLERKIKTNRAF